jgi:uncharacterized membrane protein YjgN (DUF898 family)
MITNEGVYFKIFSLNILLAFLKLKLRFKAGTSASKYFVLCVVDLLITS